MIYLLYYFINFNHTFLKQKDKLIHNFILINTLSVANGDLIAGARLGLLHSFRIGRDGASSPRLSWEERWPLNGEK